MTNTPTTTTPAATPATTTTGRLVKIDGNWVLVDVRRWVRK